MGSRFCLYELRTTDVGAARGFYIAVLGTDVWGESVRVAPLPERAVARGAPAHWLGHVGVGDLEGTSRRLTASGAEPLGPPELRADGAWRAVLRDPFGAAVALISASPPPGDRVAWHLLHARDEDRAFALYASLFGWAPTDTVDMGPGMGRHQMFAWDTSAPTVGSVADTGRMPQVHPHWLFFFRVANIDQSLEKVCTHGGITSGVIRTATGNLVAPCDDPQGAAFGLYEEPPR